MNKITLCIIAAAIVPFAGWCWRKHSDFKVGISDPVNTVLACGWREEGGVYTAQGLNVDIVNMSGGSRGARSCRPAAST